MLAIKTDIYIGLLVFIVTFIVYISSPVITSYDSRWSIHTSLSILKEGNTNLNEYEEIIKNNDFYAIENINGNLYTIFPVGASILSVPFVAAADLIFPTLMSIFPGIEQKFKDILAENGKPVEKLKFIHLYQPVELIIASFFCAATAFFIFLIASSKLPLPTAFLVVFIFSFCTSSWSTSSRALWQHGPSMLMLSITIYLVTLEDNVKGIIKYAAIPLAIAFIVRPTNAIPIFYLTGYLLINHRRQVFSYLLILLPFALAFFVYNIFIYSSLLPSYFSPDRVFHMGVFYEALAGNLVSPARGVLIYSPIFILGIVWIIKNYSKLTISSPPIYYVAILISHWIMISSFPHWWGGHSYGPRFFADMVPFFMYFSILFFIDFNELTIKKKKLLAFV